MFAKIALILSLILSVQGATLLHVNRPILSSAHPASVQQSRFVPHHLLPMFESPATTASLSIGNFPFQTATSTDGKLVLHVYGHDNAYMQQLLGIVQSLLKDPIYTHLQFSLAYTVNLYIYNSRADFLQGTNVANPAETGAFATSNPSAIYVPITNINDPDTQDFLAHELTHIVFHQNEDTGHLMDQVFRFFPLWLDEGMASSDESGTHASDFDAALQDAIASHGYTDIFQNFVYTYPKDPNTDYLSYAEARSFIQYIQKHYSLSAFHQFLVDIKDGQFLQASIKDFGVPIDLIEQQWTMATFPSTTIPSWGYWPTAFSPQATYHAGVTPAASKQTTYVAVPSPSLTIAVPWIIADASIVGIIVIMLLLMLIEQIRYALYARKQQRYAAEHAGDLLPITEPHRYASHLFAEILVLAGCALLIPAIIQGIIALDQFHTFAYGYLAAGILASMLLLFVLVRMLVQRNDTLYLVIGRAASIVIVTGFTLALLNSSATLAVTQSSVYRDAGYYTLAEHYATSPLLSSLVQKSQHIAVHRAWYQAANRIDDYSGAVQQLQAILALVPNSTQDQQSYSNEIDAWGRALLNSGSLQQAQQMYQDQLKWKECWSTCQTHMQNGLASIALILGDTDLSSGKITDAQTQYSLIVNQYAASPSYQSAKNALDNLTSIMSLQNALLKGSQGDIAGMNTALKSLQQSPNSTGGHLASAVPEAVSGTIVDANGASVAGDHLYFLGFSSRSDAVKFSSGSTILNVNIFATTIGKGGAFSIQLAPGFWYVPLWDDASQAQYYYLNGPQSTSAVFTVSPFTTQNVGTITGY